MSAVHPSVRRHDHVFDAGNAAGESATLRVVLLTSAMMVVEIAAGWWYNSMALLADGWHMSSHAVALGVSLFAYWLARRHSNDRRFSFGTWKIEILGGYSSALLLAMVAVLMMFESVSRLFKPIPIQFDQAIVVACVGLAVNIISARLLNHNHDHDHPQDCDHGHPGHDHHHDMNLRAAYLHVVADAATSVLAIVALVSGKYFGAVWLDPMMGIVGAVLVGSWAKGLLIDSGKVLLDAEMDSRVAVQARSCIESLYGVELCDLHVWRVGKTKHACIVTITSDQAYTPDWIRTRLAEHRELAHVTVEVNTPATAALP